MDLKDCKKIIVENMEEDITLSPVKVLVKNRPKPVLCHIKVFKMGRYLITNLVDLIGNNFLSVGVARCSDRDTWDVKKAVDISVGRAVSAFNRNYNDSQIRIMGG